MARQAKIRCPHCNAAFTVRQVDADDFSPEETAAIWKAFDESFKAMDRVFRAAFKPMFGGK